LIDGENTHVERDAGVLGAGRPDLTVVLDRIEDTGIEGLTRRFDHHPGIRRRRNEHLTRCVGVDTARSRAQMLVSIGRTQDRPDVHRVGDVDDIARMIGQLEVTRRATESNITATRRQVVVTVDRTDRHPRDDLARFDGVRYTHVAAEILVVQTEDPGLAREGHQDLVARPRIHLEPG